MRWWVEHGPLIGGRAEQDIWNQLGLDTEADAIKHIKRLLALGCTVHSLKSPDDRLVMDESEITSRFGLPRGA